MTTTQTEMLPEMPPEMPRRKLFIKTWGCQMNVYDSGRMADVLAPLGYEQTSAPAEADLVIFNTCHIREKASEKLFSELGRLRAVQKEREARGLSMMIAVAGCVAQAVGEEIKARAPYVDLIFGPQTYHQLPEMIARATRQKGAILNTEFPPEPKFDYLPEAHIQTGISGFLAIQEGCDRFCSYCVVPYTRGAEYSRPIEAIVDEARGLVRAGVREITLLGQNVNGYADPDSGARLGALIRRIAKLDGLWRIRYTTSHPLDMDDDLIAAHADEPKLMPYLHLPIQSGSDRILEAMNRKHKAEEYLHIVGKLRAAQPKLALSSDFIVGFPGETDKDFEATMEIVRAVGYAQAFSFKYSRRPGTPAAAMPGQVPEPVKEERLERLQALLRQQQTDFNEACAGQVMNVLFDGIGQKRQGYVFGRSPYMQAVHAQGPAELVGQEVAVRVIKGSPNSLTAEIVEEA